MSDWTQPMCDADWQSWLFPLREPVRVTEPEDEVCCICGAITSSGIYVRVDPKTVPYPSKRRGT